ncbi:MAG: TonB-dependent receptor [Deltaproteobacteria bacterium]|nr:TonB-dependent receptor [Deltaproteobacteria bacterium]
MRLRSLGFVSVFALALPLALSAQDAAPPAEEQPASLGEIEDIVVTAQKRAQSVQDVPISVAAIGGAEIDDLKISDTNDIAGLVPNLQVNQVIGDGAPVFSLRGVTMNDYSLHQSSPVAVYVDEVYAGPSVLQPIAMFDLDRIEVLRGPQGTLYGRNSTGGAVNLITRAPSFYNGGTFTFGAGDYHRFEARGAAEYALVEDVLAVRFAGMWAEADGWFENLSPGIPDGNSTDEWAVRVSALWRPSETIEVLARYSAGRSNPENYGIRAGNISQIAIENGDPTTGVGAGVYTLFNALGGANPSDYFRTGLGRREWESDKDRKRRREADQASLHVNWDISESFRITSITSWLKGDLVNPEDSDGSPLRVIEVDYLGDGDQVSQELRVTSDLEGRFNFVAGVYYAREDLDIASDLLVMSGVDFNLNGGLDSDDCADPWNAALGTPFSVDGANAEATLNGLGLSLADFVALGCTYRNSFEQERRSIAGFFDGTVDLGPNTSLLLGFRVTNDVTKAKDFTTFVEGAGVNLFDTITDLSGKLDDTEYNWKAGVEHHFGEDVLGYFTYSRGYRSGAFNGQAFFDPSEFNAVKPETLDAFEVGVKSTLADGRVQLNGAAFFYIYKEQQLIDVDPATAAQTLVNIKRSEVIGFEIEGIAQVTDRWRLSGGVGFLNGEAKKGIVSSIDVKGDTLPNAPDFSATFASDFDVYTSDTGTLAVHLDANYVGEQYFTLPHVRRTLVDNYILFDTRISFAASDEQWDFGFWIKNLANEYYETDIISLSGFGLDYTHVGPPRTFGADITFNF